ncbi:TMEM175 family protein [Cryptosporangium sp. NPDC051539]|uniref:TMEM175 family protein n=1 Tax=Cryptosporangium sp. NPDC051539 TaxID=3363962 RepID=UPI0037942456
MQAAERIPPGLTPERLGFFTDAVFAIAMTLLVVDIPKPEGGPEFDTAEAGRAEAAGNLLDFLAGRLSSFGAYLLAFAILWLVWRQHHILLDRLTRTTPRLVTLHLPLLLLAGFLPYPTAVLGHHVGNPTAAGFYAVSTGALLLARSAVQSQPLRDGLLPEGSNLVAYRRDARASWAVGWYFLATVLLCWWAPWTQIAWFAAPLVHSLFSRRLPLTIYHDF